MLPLLYHLPTHFHMSNIKVYNVHYISTLSELLCLTIDNNDSTHTHPTTGHGNTLKGVGQVAV